MSSAVRGIILRALFEPDFYNQLLNRPDEALRGYVLSPEELEAIKNPSPALYRFLQPGTDVLSQEHGALLAMRANQQPAVTTTTTTTIVVVVVATVAAKHFTSSEPGRDYDALIHSIRQSHGPARMEFIKMLIGELTKET